MVKRSQRLVDSHDMELTIDRKGTRSGLLSIR
jgi:hypothetical protein